MLLIPPLIKLQTKLNAVNLIILRFKKQSIEY